MSQERHPGAREGARRLTPEQKKRILEMRHRQKRRKRLTLAAIAAAVAALAAVLALTLPMGGRSDRKVAEPAPADVVAIESGAPEAAAAMAGPGEPAEATGEAQPSAEPGAPADAVASAEPGATMSAGASAEPTAKATKEPYVPANGVFTYDEAYVAAARGMKTGPLIKPDYSNVEEAKLERWPKVTKGYMPILYHAENVEEKVIAITVDDCFQAENLRQIVQCALDNGGKLTIFPIGSNLAKQNIGEAVKWAWESGMEIENHTYNHVGMYHYDDTRMANEMWMQNMVLNSVLGVDYKEHFFRPKGGDEREDQRVHAYAYQMGMSGIAIWTQSGSRDSMQSLYSNLAPGRIYLFHTTNNDLNKLLQFIPYVTQQGYRLVTLNELFGLPENETSALTGVSDAPALEAFRIMPAMLQKTSYIRAAAVVQKRLIELGWLSGEADGVFGQSSYIATGCFQIAADLKADGKAGGGTQAALFADDAPAATKANKAKVQAKLKS